MPTLPQTTLDFNRKIKVSNDGGALSSDTGGLLFREFDEKLAFSETLVKHLKWKDSRLYFDVSKQEVHYEETIYQAKSWSKPRKVIIQSNLSTFMF